MQEPAVIMIAGPNGAGKSSIAPGLLAKALRVVEFVNADVIARGISRFNPDGAALAAGRIMLQRLEELAAERLSFAFETTAASRGFVSRISSLKDNAQCPHPPQAHGRRPGRLSRRQDY